MTDRDWCMIKRRFPENFEKWCVGNRYVDSEKDIRQLRYELVDLLIEAFHNDDEYDPSWDD